MRIAEFLQPGQVIAELASVEKPAVLAELSEGIARGQPGLDAQRLCSVLLEREKLGSTGVGEGVAIPHGKLPGLSGLAAAFGRKKAGLDFASIDGKPTQLFFVLFAPENSAGVHLKALARISRLFKQPMLRQQILAADGADAIYRLIVDEDARY